MKLVFALLFAVVASSTAFADTQQLPLLGPVEATLIESFEGCKHIVLLPGTFEQCTVSEFDSLNMTTWKCNPSQAAAEMHCADGTSFRFTFDKVFIQHKSWKKRWVDEYRFSGVLASYTALIPADAEIVLDVWNFVDQPGNYRGGFEIRDYGVSKALVGHPIR